MMKKFFMVVLLPILFVLALIGFDQLTKYIAVATLKGNAPKVLIDGVLELHYLENQGAAWGMLQNKVILFAILTLVFLVVAVYYYVRVPKTMHFLPLTICVLVMVAGAIGNFIDRVMNQYVVDFIYFKIINFPIFNVADIYVSLGVVFLLIFIVFKYKDGELRFLFRRKEA